ncbi:MAG TPA: trimeric intracellular cation channel family protein [Dermatophilaceae bacterium]|nr:trimeric intracellular cation channel family protein [Dermatophilaceae bacterium]HOA03599.1 trimeric intracellular cation channel family protein [Dermatophilaceae bacterium]HOF35591.1 trimeric intracellular cation channel family protein [Dermatophilaceae bacterium]HOI03892.1 trimeric intracellular cation channel family protein [Dermatophilaceae bacterium]HOR14432.1 trimeric intracellular cation channel family protein [Dermatophilaceae bacterium]
MTRWIDVAHDVFVLAGVLAFAMSGALQAVGRRMDVVGICSLGVVTAVGGGILRDLLIGAVPPAALTDWTLVPVALVGSLIVFWSHGRWTVPRRPMLVLDALGLGLFCVEGTVKALGFGLNPYASAVVGMLTGVGGGVIRDVLAGQIPSVFRHGSRLYVIPALAGGGITAALWSAGHFSLLALLAVAATVSAIRIASLRFRWRAASPRDLDLDVG